MIDVREVGWYAEFGMGDTEWKPVGGAPGRGIGRTGYMATVGTIDDLFKLFCKSTLQFENTLWREMSECCCADVLPCVRKITSSWLLEYGTLPIVIGTVTDRFLWKVPSFASTFNSYLMWMIWLVVGPWVGGTAGTSKICSTLCSDFLSTPSMSFFKRRFVVTLMAIFGVLLWYSTIW